MLKNHTNSAFDSELRFLRDRILLIAGRVEKMVANSIKAIAENNLALARTTIEQEKNIDRDELFIDRFCLELLARRQPFGQDLRFIVAIIKMANYFERLGDLARKICQRIIELKYVDQLQGINDITLMAKDVQSMIKDTLDAFVLEDCAIAMSVIEKDAKVDDMFHLTTKRLLGEIYKNEHDGEHYYHLWSIAKWLERMGDLCINLAELIVFIIKGEDIRYRHISEQPDKRS